MIEEYIRHGTHEMAACSHVGLAFPERDQVSTFETALSNAAGEENFVGVPACGALSIGSKP
jgi:hypothetical protein